MYSTTLELPKGRYAIHLRKSREDEEAERRGKYESLAYHEQALLELAASYGVTVASEDIFRELASGERLDNCPVTMGMVRRVAAGDYAGVFTRELTRFTRGDLMDQGRVVAAFELSHTLIITPGARPIDLSNRYDRRNAERDLQDGRNELGWYKDRMMASKVARTKSGQYLAAHAPFGWDKSLLPDKRKTVVPNVDNPLVVQWCHELAAGRLTAYGAITDLNRRYVPSPTGKEWTPAVFCGVIRNPVHAGYVRWNAYKIAEELTSDFRRTKRKVRCEEPIIEKGLHEGTVPEDIWRAACHALDHGTTPRMSANLKLRDPLAGLLKCRECGHAMHRRQAKSREYYTHHDPNRHKCWMVGSSLSTVMDAVADALESVLEDIEAPLGHDGAERELSEGKLRQLQRSLDDSRSALDNLMRLAEKGLITDDEFAQRRRVIDAGAKETQAQVKALTEQMANALPKQERVARVRDAIRVIRGYEGNAAEVNSVLKAIVKRVDYAKKEQKGTLELDVLIR